MSGSHLRLSGSQSLSIVTNHKRTESSAAYVLKRDSAIDITITQMFITLAIMLEEY